MSQFLLNKWANGPQIWGQFRHKIFWGVILLLFDKIMLKFQISWKSDHFWPKFTIEKPFLLSKSVFWKISLSNYLFQVGIFSMPCPDKNPGARNPFMFIVFMQLQCWNSYTELITFRGRTCFHGCSCLGPMKALHNATPMEIPQSCCYLIYMGIRLSYFHGGKEVLWGQHKLCVESSHKNSSYSGPAHMSTHTTTDYSDLNHSILLFFENGGLMFS